jgi:hypothetical protein
MKLTDNGKFLGVAGGCGYILGNGEVDTFMVNKTIGIAEKKLMNLSDDIPVARKYSVITEIIDIFTQACKVCIHDEDVAETDFEHTFETPKGF